MICKRVKLIMPSSELVAILFTSIKTAKKKIGKYVYRWKLDLGVGYWMLKRGRTPVLS